MRVMLISTNGDEAGAPRHVEFLSTGLRGEVEFFYVFGSKGAVYSRCNNIAPDRVCLLSGLSSSLRPLVDIFVLVQLCILVYRVKPDLVHSHSSKAGLLARLAGLLMHVPVVHTIHGWPWREFVGLKRAVIIALERVLARVSNAYYIGVAACVFSEAKSVNLELRESRACVIHNTTVVSRAGKTSSFPSAPITKPYILMPARVSAAKDHCKLAKAFSMSDYGGVLTLAGGGTECEMFKDRIRNEIGDDAFSRVRFLGERSDILELMREADAVVLCSHFETFPLTILEAFALQKVVAASDVGGCREIIVHEQNGFLAKSLSEWVSVLNRLKNFTSRRDIELQARSTYEKDFDANVHFANLKYVYEAALNNKPLGAKLSRGDL